MSDEIEGQVQLDATIRALKEAGIEIIHIVPSTMFENDKSIPRLYMSYKHFDRFSKAIEPFCVIKNEISKD